MLNSKYIKDSATALAKKCIALHKRRYQAYNFLISPQKPVDTHLKCLWEGLLVNTTTYVFVAK